MFLYYDRVSKMFTLDKGEDVVFLGPITNALVNLKSEGFSDSQAREAVLQAVFNMGDSVNMDDIKKIACTTSKYYEKHMQEQST